VDVGRVASWAADFERLLDDPVGLQTFAEFLKKEFSAENIVFWVSCERYRRKAAKQGASADEIKRDAEAIMERHLAQGAPDPVNVDSHARQAAQDAEPASANAFSAAQKQIYNLMKFDSFSRFLKSDLYKESLMAEMAGRELPFADALDAEVMIEVVTEVGNASASGRKKDENRRRSLLPWANRGKSKERPLSASGRKGKESRASLASVDSQPELTADEAAVNCTLARVILPDKATTVVQTKKGETIRAMVARLLEKRGLRLTSFDVFATADSQGQQQQQPQQQRPLDLGEDSSTLGCTEVRVEPRVLFRLELPSGKSIGVKAKPAKVAKDVLGPILSQYGWDLSAVTVRREREGRVVDLESTVASIDNTRLVVAVNEVRNGSLRSTSSLDSQHQRLMRPHSATDDEKLAMPPPTALPPRRHTSQHRARPPITNAVVSDGTCSYHFGSYAH